MLPAAATASKRLRLGTGSDPEPPPPLDSILQPARDLIISLKGVKTKLFINTNITKILHLVIMKFSQRTTDDQLSRALAVPNVLIVFIFSQNKKKVAKFNNKNLSNSKPKKNYNRIIFV